MTAAPISVRELAKAYGATAALRGVSFDFAPGRIHGLLGENGAGKSTLLRILAGAERADKGTAGVAPADVILAPQHGSLLAELTVLENFAVARPGLGRVAWRTVAAQAAARLAELGVKVDLDAPAGRLDPAVARLVEYARALWLDRPLVLLDEPAALLNQPQAQQLFAALRRQAAARGTAFVVSSHRIDELRAAAAELHVLRAGAVTLSRPRDEASNADLAAAMFGTAATPPARPAAPAPARAGPPVLAVRGLALAGQPQARIDLELFAGEAAAIVGMAGNGQRELMDVLCGLAPPAAGAVELYGAPPPPGDLKHHGVGRLPSDPAAAAAAASMTVAENAAMHEHVGGGWRRGLQRLAWRDCEARAAALIAAERLAIGGARDEFGWLSGGNQRKLLLARECGGDTRLLLARNPEAGLDLQAVAALRDRLAAARAAGAAVLLIAEDLDFVAQAADRVLLLERGGLAELPAANWREEFHRRVNA
ncbi:MAG: ATP-binding cassette domain-containing protein [Betaproteobacteria bacterium AqS2]|uniref:ATP-binding cassette domain-containing protein n=1 Tax=Candidatus Amphirhobacter heronislandensis TaxID=1732024 RepID=A0A930UCV3_9GAMM|nr:ATP-binding cassette domain-containing protein [Betaproteobacteria bacterium AqS2]